MHLWRCASEAYVPDDIEGAVRPFPSARHPHGQTLVVDWWPQRVLSRRLDAAVRCGESRATASWTSEAPHPSSGTTRRTQNTMPSPSPHPLTACALAPCAQLDNMGRIDRFRALLALMLSYSNEPALSDILLSEPRLLMVSNLAVNAVRANESRSSARSSRWPCGRLFGGSGACQHGKRLADKVPMLRLVSQF